MLVYKGCAARSGPAHRQPARSQLPARFLQQPSRLPDRQTCTLPGHVSVYLLVVVVCYSRSGPYTGTLKEAKETTIAMEGKIKDKRASSDAKAPMTKESTPSNGSAAAAREVSAQKSPRKRRKVNHGKSRALFQKSSVATANCLGQCDHELVSHCGLAYHLIDSWSKNILSFLPSATGVVTWLTHYTPLQLVSTVAVR